MITNLVPLQTGLMDQAVNSLGRVFGEDRLPYVILTGFAIWLVLSYFDRVRTIFTEFLPDRRRDRLVNKQLDFAERLCTLHKIQEERGISLVDVEEAWRERFPPPEDEEEASPSAVPATPRRSAMPAERRGRAMSAPRDDWASDKPRFSVIAMFGAILYLFMPAGILMVLAEENLGLDVDTSETAGGLALLLAPALTVLLSCRTVPAERWMRGAAAYYGSLALRVAWKGPLAMIGLYALFFVLFQWLGLVEPTPDAAAPASE